MSVAIIQFYRYAEAYDKMFERDKVAVTWEAECIVKWNALNKCHVN